MNKVNAIIISRKDYDNVDQVYYKVGETIRTLLESGYVVVAEDIDDRVGSVLIQFMPSTDKGAPRETTPKPFWLLPSEAVSAASAHMDNEMDHAEEILHAGEVADKFASFMDEALKKKKGGKGGKGGNDGSDA